MRNHFVKFLDRKIILVMVGLFIITGAAGVIIPVNVAHADTVNCQPQIQEGSTNTDAVNALHSALKSHYNHGDLKNGNPYTFLATSDGAFGGGFGPETRKAVLDYQSQKHLKDVDGMVGPETWGSLLGVTYFPNISEGTSDSATTKILQNILISKKYSVGSSKADGQFGPNTTKAVIAFQKSHWPNDPSQWNGMVGPQTWQALGYCSTEEDHYGSNSSSSSNNGKSGSSKASGNTSCSAGQTLIHGACYTCKAGTEVYNNGQVVACDSNTANSSTSTSTISTTAYNYCIAGQNGPDSLPYDKTVDCSQPSAAAEQLCENGYNAHGYSSDAYTACADYNKH